jgi:FkbM family methyltransferase
MGRDVFGEGGASPGNVGERASHTPRPLTILWKIARLLRRYRLPFVDRVLRLLHNPDKQMNPIRAIIPYGERRVIQVDTSSFIEWQIFFYGHYERHLVDLFRRLIGKGHVVMDIGANIGCHTLLMSQWAKSVFAVEPSFSVFERLQRNVRLNGVDNVTLVNRALSDSDGTATLFTPPKSYPNQGTASLHKRNLTAEDVGVSVHTMTLDTLMGACKIPHVDLIKIDVEGHELDVLRGSQQVLRERMPRLVFEFDPECWQSAGRTFGSCVKFLNQFGYRLYGIKPSGMMVPLTHSPTETTDILATI